MSALIARDDIEAFGQQIDYFTFALVAPLRAEDDDVAHVLWRCPVNHCSNRMLRDNHGRAEFYFAARLKTSFSVAPSGTIGITSTSSVSAFSASVKRRLKVSLPRVSSSTSLAPLKYTVTVADLPES